MLKYLLYLHHLLFFRKGKHTAIAKTHLDQVVGFFTKIDPNLGNLVIKSKPGESDGASKKSSSSGGKKRKGGAKDSPDASTKKKANMGSNGTLTLSQREARAMDLLATYLKDRGGRLSFVIDAVLNLWVVL